MLRNGELIASFVGSARGWSSRLERLAPLSQLTFLASYDVDHARLAQAYPSLPERLRAAVAGEPFPVADGQLLRVTCSVGVVTLGDETSVHEFVDAADQALLEAKRQGKNRVIPRGLVVGASARH